ncbi:MAG: tyrosine-type recombinase/integrase [Alphaproteobacteria bacterium]
MGWLQPADEAYNGLGEENMPIVVGETAMVPAFIATGGERAGFAFIDFFMAKIRNRNTRAAYAVAVRAFCSWADTRGLILTTLRTYHVATYVELLGKHYSPPTVKQHLAAVRMLFDWLVVRQVIEMNPAAAVRGPKHVVKRGKTPVLEADEARQLLASIDVSTVVGLRDRALIGLLIYTFARVSAAIGMNVEDYYVQGRRSWVRLHEKGGKQHDMPAHHLLETYIDAYLTEAGIASDKDTSLFRTAAGKTGKLTDRRMTRTDALRMIWRRARAADIETELGCHSFRATGITVYLQNGGLLEHAQQMAAHESARTTKLYDRRNDKVTLDEVEKIML